MKVLFLTRYGKLGASSRVRALQYMPRYEAMGIECTVAPFFDDEQLAGRYRQGGYDRSGLLQSYGRRLNALRQKHHYDILWIEKEALPWLPASFERWLLKGVPYVLDYDDAVYHNYDLHSSVIVRRLFGGRIDHLMAGSRLVIAGNVYLAQRAREAGAPRIEIVPTVIDLDRYPAKSYPGNAAAPLRIVWIGSPYTLRYLKIVHDALKVLSRQCAIRLRVICGDAFSMDGVDVETVKWSEDIEAASIRECDIGIMPLYDTPWEQGKCGYKLIQYMACGLPVVASPVGVNKDIVRSGGNGFIADTGEAWMQALGKLAGDAGLRQEMGEKGRRQVEERYCIQKTAPQMAMLFKAIRNK